MKATTERLQISITYSDSWMRNHITMSKPCRKCRMAIKVLIGYGSSSLSLLLWGTVTTPSIMASADMTKPRHIWDTLCLVLDWGLSPRFCWHIQIWMSSTSLEGLMQWRCVHAWLSLIPFYPAMCFRKF